MTASQLWGKVKIVALVLGLAPLVYAGYRGLRLLESLSGAERARDAAIARADSALAQGAQARATRDSTRRALAASQKKVVVLEASNAKLIQQQQITDHIADSLQSVLDSIPVLTDSSTASDSAEIWHATSDIFEDMWRNQMLATGNLTARIRNRDSLVLEQSDQITTLTHQGVTDSTRIVNLESALVDLRKVAEPRCFLGLVKCPNRTLVYFIGAGSALAVRAAATRILHKSSD